MTTIEKMLAAIKAREIVACPHCGRTVDMTDCDRVQGYVTYWGEDEPRAISCYGCDADFYIKERVTRHWTVGRTADEAAGQ